MKFEPRRFTLVLLVVGSTLTTLTACFPLAVGGAVVGGMVATDRRTTGTVVEDEGIELRSASRIRAAMGECGHINVPHRERIGHSGQLNTDPAIIGLPGHRPGACRIDRRQRSISQRVQNYNRTWYHLRHGSCDRP